MYVKAAPLIFVMLMVIWGVPENVYAFPWDVDMYRQESLSSGEIARSPARGTLPLSYRAMPESLEDFEKETQVKKNPRAFAYPSVLRGKRLWNTNCLPCHGAAADGQGKVGLKMGAPSLLPDAYKEKTDSRIFGVMYYGLRAMPRLGFKLSDLESWDIVNYLRFLQGRDVAGIIRPEKEQAAGDKK